MWQLGENINIWIRIYINIYLVGGCVVNWIIEPIIVSPESITITITRYSYIQVPHCIETIQYLHRAVQNFKWFILGNEVCNIL